MVTQEINQKLRDAIKLRHLVDAISENWQELSSVKKRVLSNLDVATKYIETYGSESAQEAYNSKTLLLKSNIADVEKVLNQAYSVLSGESNDTMSIHWDSLQSSLTSVEEVFLSMENFNESYFSNGSYNDWLNIWYIIKSNLYIIKGVSNSSFIQLKMMEHFNKEEQDALTKSIVKNIPRSFSLLDAVKYEREYLAAMDAIEKEANAEDNLWDRFLNLLAGAVPFKQTPAERVMMQRWLEGEKGDL
jgi:hypothetical protein